jgi:hypothetical protein
LISYNDAFSRPTESLSKAKEGFRKSDLYINVSFWPNVDIISEPLPALQSVLALANDLSEKDHSLFTAAWPIHFVRGIFVSLHTLSL